jgi:CubicO group peptidase (beta-lactamase class C family)
VKGTVRKAFAAASVCLALGGCASAPKRPPFVARGDYSYTREYVSWRIREEMRRHDVTGLSIALVDDQRVVWAEGFGYADRAADVPAAPETVYRVGSISKLFTATAAMQLAEDGRLDIDAPLQSVLPQFSIRSRFPDAGPVTARALMTHHSGLPSDLLKGMWTRDPESFDAVVTAVRDEYLSQPPGTVYSYSNLGVTLLGIAVETVAGRDFGSHMEESVLGPLGMAQSSFSTGPDTSPQASRAYRNGEEVEDTPLRDVPAGGLNSSVDDLSRFLRMVFARGRSDGRRIVRPETVAEMLRPQNAGVPLDLDLRVGLGWALGGLGDIDLRGAGPVAHHSGATLSHRSMLIALPRYKLGVVVLANSSSAGPAVNKVATDAIKLALEAKTGVRQPDRVKPAESGAPLSPETLQAYEGRYATRAGTVSIRDGAGALRADLMDRTFRLVPLADGLLGIRYNVLWLFPASLGGLDYVGVGRADIAGHHILTARIAGKEMLLGERIRAVPIPPKWLARLGEYEIVNPGADTVLLERMRLREENGLLLVDYSMPLFFKGTMSMALEPVSDSEAVLCGLGRGLGETIRAEIMEGEERLLYSGYVFRRESAE